MANNSRIQLGKREERVSDYRDLFLVTVPQPEALRLFFWAIHLGALKENTIKAWVENTKERTARISGG